MSPGTDDGGGSRSHAGEDRRLVSIVIPALNEADNIPQLERELLETVEKLPYDFEFIVVDNHSSDATPTLLRELCARDRRWRYLRFSRNFTVEASIAAGYRVAAGDAIIVLYSDLQDPPDQIPRLLDKWLEGWDVVYGVRTVRAGDPKWRNLAVRCAYQVIGRLSDVPIPANAGDFRLITSRVRDALALCGEYNRYTRGLIAWLGFSQVGVPYERRARAAGRSKVSLVHLVTFMFTAVTSFSLKPLRIFTILGFLLIGVALAAVPVYVGLYFTGSPPPGMTTAIILILVAIGVNSLGIGVLGEYLGRTYAEVKNRPIYLVEEAVNVDARGGALLPIDDPDGADPGRGGSRSRSLTTRR